MSFLFFPSFSDFVHMTHNYKLVICHFGLWQTRRTSTCLPVSELFILPHFNHINFSTHNEISLWTWFCEIPLKWIFWKSELKIRGQRRLNFCQGAVKIAVLAPFALFAKSNRPKWRKLSYYARMAAAATTCLIWNRLIQCRPVGIFAIFTIDDFLIYKLHFRG